MIAFVRALIAVVLMGAAWPSGAGEIRIGVLKFGTVSWELDSIRTHGLDAANGVTLQIVPLANKQATTVALQGGAVDMIVSDWFWVSRQRSEGADYTFVPYSATLGAIMVAAESPVRTLADLAGKKVGIAGGPLDKSWLVLRALALERHGFDLKDRVEAVFGAPPLLSEQIKAGRLDAVITFWHYAARLEAAGFRRLVAVADALAELGIASRLPLIGYVFSEAWGNAHRDDVLRFMAATRAAKALLRKSDSEWERLKPLTRASDQATISALAEGFRAGIPERWGADEQRDAERLFALLAELGGPKLVGPGGTLAPGTFWPSLSF